MKTEEVKFMQSFEQTVLAMRNEALQYKNLKAFDGIRENVKKLISSILPNSKVEIHFFGSRVIGYGTKDSDLDIFVEIDGSYASGVSQAAAEHFNTVVLQFNNSPDWKVNTVVWKTPVPVIKASPTFMNVDCEYLNIYHCSKLFNLT